jgi:hypothetical protein
MLCISVREKRKEASKVMEREKKNGMEKRRLKCKNKFFILFIILPCAFISKPNNFCSSEESALFPFFPSLASHFFSVGLGRIRNLSIEKGKEEKLFHYPPPQRERERERAGRRRHFCSFSIFSLFHSCTVGTYIFSIELWGIECSQYLR